MNISLSIRIAGRCVRLDQYPLVSSNGDAKVVNETIERKGELRLVRRSLPP